MSKTSIQWTDFSTNPIRARHKTTGAVGHYCELASPGCAHCYSSTLQKRFKMPPFGKKHSGDIEPFLDESKLRDVLRRQKPTKFFWCDMTDLFGDWVPDDWIDKCFATMALSSRHTHQVLTKRAERMQEYVRGLDCKQGFERLEAAARALGWTLHFHDLPLVRWPIPNVWLGVSVENQKYADDRIPHLLNTPAAVRFLSCEPLLGTVDLLRVVWPGLAKPSNPREPHRVDVLRGGYWEDAEVFYKGFVNHSDMPGTISWVIAGGESGHGSRPMHPDWLRSLRDQCQAARVPYFFKQFGEFVPVDGRAMDHRRPGVYVEPDGKWRDAHIALPSPEAALMRRVGKKAAGRLLDGRTWDEFPKVEAAQ